MIKISSLLLFLMCGNNSIETLNICGFIETLNRKKNSHIQISNYINTKRIPFHVTMDIRK